jgi:hypothetical protein
MKANEFIDGVEILGVTVVLYGEIEENEHVDLGALTIKRGNREYILDVVQSYRKFEGGFTTIETDLEKDEDTFDECPYDITSEDLMSDDLDIEFFIDGDFSANIEYITLFVRFGGENGMTKAIDIQSEVDFDDEEFED